MNTSKKLEFGDYWREAMLKTLPAELVPTGLVVTVGAGSANIVAWSEAAKSIGARATLKELVAAVMMNGGPGASSVGLVAVGAAKAAVGVTAAYWLGCCFGALVYAVQMTTIGDSWMDKLAASNVRQLVDQARSLGIQVPDLVVPGVLHSPSHA